LRAGALVGLLTGAGYLIYHLLIHPLTKKSDDLSLALRIEELYPELNDALASTIQFLDQPDAPSGGDKQMRAKAIEKATRQAASFDFNAILDYRLLGLSALAFVVSLAAAGHFLYHEPEALVGRNVVIVANLQPAKLMGVESNGMVLAATVGEAGEPSLLEVAADVPPGSTVK
jgi:hypothetical protein